MWQSCPVCKGEGRVRSKLHVNMPDTQCTVCKGKKIISELTGHPPAEIPQENKNVNYNKDFHKELTGVADPLKSIKFL
jgi:DnaJ-class molecular chaperone